MMKTNLLLFALLSSSFFHSQCYINGNEKIKTGETHTYSLENTTAECTDCYGWQTLSSNISVIDGSKQRIVNIKGNSAGRSILSVMAQSGNRKIECSKIIDVYDGLSPTNVDCDVIFDGFKEQKTAENTVVFSPLKPENNRTEWVATYVNGDVKKSGEPVANFEYKIGDGIKTLEVKISSSKCTRTFTKNYDPHFWAYF